MGEIGSASARVLDFEGYQEVAKSGKPKRRRRSFVGRKKKEE